MWEWQLWRNIDDIRETFEERGWGFGFGGHGDGGAMPPEAAASGDYCVAFFKRDTGTGECWFELRDNAQRRRVFVHGTHNIPTPEGAAELLANHGGPLYEITSPGERSMYGLPVAPLVRTTENT